VRIDYDERENPVAFKLVFKKTEMLLEASDQSSCRHWVKSIERGEHAEEKFRSRLLMYILRMEEVGSHKALQTVCSTTTIGGQCFQCWGLHRG